MAKKTATTTKNFFQKLNHKKIVRILWLIFGGGMISVILVFTLISLGVIGYMPTIEDLENPIDKYASQVYSSDNELLGTYSMAKNNRIYSTYDELSPYLVQALVSTEDARFYNHSGIDAYALARAIVKTGLLRQSSGGGGSTITQQLSKQLYSPPADNFMERILQKPIEWVIAVQLEKYYTKEEIINMYLNYFDFLNNAVGIQSAAHVYFNKVPKDLNIQEAAMLIGMCKNPSYFNPVRRPEKAIGRRNEVLKQMVKSDYITQQECDSLTQTKLVLDYKRADHKEGLAPYFREYLRLMMSAKKPSKSNYQDWQLEQYAQDSLSWDNNPLYGWCNKNRKPDGGTYNLATDGLKIYTSIDSRMQAYAEESMTEHMSQVVQPAFDRQNKGRSYAPYEPQQAKNIDALMQKAMKQTDRYRKMKAEGFSEKEIEKVFKEPIDMKVFSWKGDIDTIMTPIDSIRYHKGFMRSGFMAMDTHNGQVRAYVGGINFNYFQYDMVNMGRRQVGSTIKPFLYASAMEDGMTPCDEMLHVQQTLIDENGREWSPRNPQKRVGEMVTIKWGLQNSDNWVTAYLMKQTTPYAFARMLHSFGITGRIDAVVSMCLGTHDVSVAEMASAYTSFANKGFRSSPVYVTHIEDSHGNIIANFTTKVDEVLSPTAYARTLDMLRAVIDGGTGGRMRRYVAGPMGGKTGTTQNNSDGWFMGFTPRLVAACWVGGDEKSIRFYSIAEGQGAAVALPIFGLFMKKVYADPKLDYKATDQFESAGGGGICDRDADDGDGDVDSNNQPAEIDNIFN